MILGPRKSFSSIITADVTATIIDITPWKKCCWPKSRKFTGINHLVKLWCNSVYGCREIGLPSYWWECPGLSILKEISTNSDAKNRNNLWPPHAKKLTNWEGAAPRRRGGDRRMESGWSATDEQSELQEVE